jgi:hypothetical protein
MSKSDYSNIEHNDIPLWKNHEYIDFKTSAQMLEWVSNDKVNFVLSDKVYTAMLDCLNRGVEETIVATIIVENGTSVDVVIRKPNFQKILSSYTQRLLNAENYEKLSVIKKEMQKFNLEI